MTNSFFRARLMPALLILTAAVMFVSSCSKDETSDSVSISVSPTTASSTAGTATVTVKCSGQWLILLSFSGESTSWASLSPASGNGDADVTLQYDLNKSSEPRTVNLTLTGSGNSATCSFTQEAMSASGDDDTRQGVDVSPLGWMELPATVSGDGLSFYTHDQTIGTTLTRNYSFYWDKENHLSHWVAYPLNAWLIGSGSRSDVWGQYDPLVPENEQANLSKSYSNTNGNSYDRGHQIPSADRYYLDANLETFYPTNMTPQNSNFNQNLWANVETKVRNWSKASGTDTLYVVTGCVIDGYSEISYDADNMTCPVPVAYYKAVLRYSRSGEGHSGYMGAAVYFDHKSYSDDTVYASYSLSIADLEEKVGVEFFVNLPSAIGDEATATVKNENPAEVEWWGFVADK